MQKNKFYKFIKKIRTELLSFSFLASLIWFIRSPIWASTESLELVVEPKTTPISDKIFKKIYKKAKKQYIWNFSPTNAIKEIERTISIKPRIVTLIYPKTSILREMLPPKLFFYLRHHQLIGIVFDEDFNEFVGVIDTQGNLFKNIKEEQVILIEHLIGKPLIKFRGVENFRHKIRWNTLYKFIKKHPMSIHEIYWNEKNQMVIGTEVGPIYIGDYEIDPIELRRRLLMMEKVRNLITEGKLFREVPIFVPDEGVFYIDIAEFKISIIFLMDNVESFRVKN